MRSPIPLALCALALSSSCAPRLGPIPGPLSEAAVARAAGMLPGASADLLGKGRQLFIDRCDQCHGYPDVWFYEEKKWPGIMKEMAENAELTPEERDLTLNFVLVARGEPRPTAPSK